MNIKAVIKKCYSPDIPDLSKYRPEDPICFRFVLQVVVGPENSDGEESFNSIVCTPNTISRVSRVEDIIIGRHHLILLEYNYNRLMNQIRNIIESCEGSSWKSCRKYRSFRNRDFEMTMKHEALRKSHSDQKGVVLEKELDVDLRIKLLPKSVKKPGVDLNVLMNEKLSLLYRGASKSRGSRIAAESKNGRHIVIQGLILLEI